MVSADAPVEEIQLTASAVPEDEPSLEERPIRLRFDLVQRNPSRGIHRQFAVGSDDRLHVAEQARRLKRSYQVGLAFLDPEPHRRLILAKWWAYLAGACLLATLALTALSSTKIGSALSFPLFSVVVLCAALGIVSLLALIYRSRLLLYYRTRHGGVALVEFLWGRPSRRDYQDFIARLSGAIREAQRNYAGGLERVLADELREHRRLHESGIIDSGAYNAAKGRILAAHGNPGG